MKAARIHAFGGSEKVRVETVPLPRMRKNTALVRIRAAAVNPVDWAVREKIPCSPGGRAARPRAAGNG
jgi:NADPH:quinone reductase-like Zn-dependent oxidoreductase